MKLLIPVTLVAAALLVCVTANPAAQRQHPLMLPHGGASAVPLLSAENATPIPDSYIVVLRPDADVAEHHAFLYESLVAMDPAYSTQAAENELKHVYDMGSSFRGYSGRFSSPVLDAIRARPDVAYVERNQEVRAWELQRNAPWGLSRVSHREPLTFRNFNRYLYDPAGGEGVTCYVVDTGINIDHVDFEGRASWGVDIPGDAAMDGNGHGSHVAGTMVGSRYGVAKKANVVAVKVLRANGSGTMEDVLRGVEWVAQAHQEAERLAAEERNKGGKPKHRGSVANMSLGGGLSKALNAAVNAAVDAGVHFAVAAGNDDADACDYSPASAQKAVTVGASTIEDERAWFSNKGKCVDVFAPGKDVTSVWIGGKTATNTISGTSMASPHVAGLLAYLLSLESGPITPKELKQKLIDLSTKDVLDKVPHDTPNLLVFSDPPASLVSEESIESRVEERVEEIMHTLQDMFQRMGEVETNKDEAIELEWSWE